jgi:3D (Asp-Asp-Asp) domain-containing protein
MLLTNSFGRKIVAMLGAIVGFVFVYEATIRDSRQAILAETPVEPQPGARLHYTATAYCKGETTASGVAVRTGIAAADPQLLPVGTVVRITTQDTGYDGIWTIMDTGPAVQGRIVDLYMWSCHDALAFGRQPIQLSVLRLGWHPRNSEPGRVDMLYRRREVERARLPLAPGPDGSSPADRPPVVPAMAVPPS